MRKFIASPVGKVSALVVVLAMCLLVGQAATATSQPAAERVAKTVAHTRQGDVKSRIVGQTGNGRSVTGSFVPLRFARHHGKLVVRGLVQGVVHEKNGTRTTFAKLRTIRVKAINGTPARAGRASAALAPCDILHLVLAPLNLDLLGLQVHLSRVVLNIVAVSGAGNLLGNLLCAVAGLLDGGIGGALARVSNLLNRVLGVLRLG